MTIGNKELTAPDIILILGIPHKHKTNHVSFSCPFCGDKGYHADVTLYNQKYGKEAENFFRCNKCGAAGNALKLYADYYGISTKDAIKQLNNNEAAEQVSYRRERKSDDTIVFAKPASAKDKHKTYSELLSILTLSEEHKEDLLRRGLTEEEIVRYRYKSCPQTSKSVKVAEELLKRGCTLEGVAGFAQRTDGKWVFCSSNGYLIPFTDVNGVITGLQIRTNQKKKKYIWLSSAAVCEYEKEYNKGIKASTDPCVVGYKNQKFIFLTEGGLKAQVANRLFKKLNKDAPFVALAGVANMSSLISTLKDLKTKGLTTVYEAYDMDKLSNEAVINAQKNVIDLCKSLDLEVKTFKWDANYKGIDDFLLSKLKG